MTEAHDRDSTTGSTAAPPWRRLMLAAAVASSVAVLPSCSAWSWTKGKIGLGPPPAAEFPPPPAPLPAPAPAPATAPVAEPALPPPPPIEAPAPVDATPLPPSPAFSPTPPPPAFAPSSSPSSAFSSSTPAPAPRGDLRRGSFAVQVGVFLVASNAETIRARVASQLAGDGSFDASEVAVRTVKKGQRTYVVVGDAPDRRSAEALAERVRAALRQDVVVFQR